MDIRQDDRKCKGREGFKVCPNCGRYAPTPSFQEGWVAPMIRRDKLNVLRCELYVRGLSGKAKV